MNGMNFKPFIAKLLDSLSDEQVKSLYDLINSHGNNFKKRSLIDNSNLLTTSDKGIGLYTIQLDSETIKTGYLIYNDTYCVLLGYVSNSERVSEYVIDMTKKTWSMVKEFITTDYFRHEVAIRAVSVGELVEVEVDDINSGDTAAGRVIVSDGEGGAQWGIAGVVIESTISEIETEKGDEFNDFMRSLYPGELVFSETDNIAYQVGIDSVGNIEFKAYTGAGVTVAEYTYFGTTNNYSYNTTTITNYGVGEVDSSFVPGSENAVQSKVIQEAFVSAEEETDAKLETKANVDGNYPTMTVGVADNLSPYDEESGADQDEPFSFQATGTANGSDPTFSTGAYALMKEKQGNSVVVNQSVRNQDFSSGTDNWTLLNSSITVSNGVASFIASAVQGTFYQLFPVISGHKYLVMFFAKLTTYSSSFRFYFDQGTLEAIEYANTTNWQLISTIRTATVTKETGYIQFVDNRTGDWDTIQFKNIICIDLTQMFNGNIPQDLLDNPSNFFRYYQGSLAYNEGTLVNADSQYVKCIGRQQWDEEWELGTYSSSDGSKSVDNTKIRSKNYIRVIPNTTYYGKGVGRSTFFYDENKNYIGNAWWNTDATLTIPSDVVYITFAEDVSYGTTYKNDITLSIYYSDESGYDQYYQYEVLTNNDTGTEVLRSAGSVKDSKVPSGLITRKVGSVDLGTLTFTKISNWGSGSQHTLFYVNQFNLAESSETINTLCPKYTSVTRRDGNLNTTNKTIFINAYSQQTDICIIDDDFVGDAAAFKIAMSGVYLYYELVEPTTEQGTPFSENLIIDDFGTMSFEGTSGVPQGNLIFYPVDYKAFIDTAYDYTNGDPDNLALKSDLPTAPETYLKSLSGYDATKTQTLKNVNGTLTWVDD